MTKVMREDIKALFSKNGYILKTAVLREYGIESRDISELLKERCIIKIRRGVYAWQNKLSELNGYQILQCIVPECIISVQSAASIHNLTSIKNKKFSITIPTTKIKPRLPDDMNVDLFFSIDKNFNLGEMDYVIEGVNVKIYNQERTVCDYYKYINRLGDDSALEILKQYMLKEDRNLNLLFEYADKLRVKKYIKPYVEALR